MTITVVDADRRAHLPAGLHVHRDGRRAGRAAPAPGARRCSTSASTSWSARSTSVDAADADRHLGDGQRAAPTTSWCWPPGRGSCPRRSSTSTPRPSTSTPPRRRSSCGAPSTVRRRPDRHRHRRHALQVPAGAARGRVPDRGRAARARPAGEESTIDYCSPIGRAFTIESVSEMATPILEQKGIELHTFFNVEAIDPERKVVLSLEGEELPYDLLILVPPHKGQQFLIDSGLAPAPGGWLPTDRATLQVGGRPERLRPGRRDRPAAVEGGLHRPLRGAGRHRADRRRDPGSRGGPPPRRLPGQGDVLLRDRRRQGHAAPVRLRASAPAAQARTASGTWARSCSTRRTGTRSPRAASSGAGPASFGSDGPSPRADRQLGAGRPRA